MRYQDDNDTRLHPLQRRQRQQPHRRTQHIPRAHKQIQSRQRQILLLPLHFEDFPCLTDQVAQLEAERDDRRGLVVDECVSDDLRVRRDDVDDFPGFRLGQEGHVNLGEVVGHDDVGVLSLHRA